MIINLDGVPSIEFYPPTGNFRLEQLRHSNLDYLYESKNSKICQNNKVFLLRCPQYHGLYSVSVKDILGPSILKSIKNKEIILAFDFSSESDYGMIDAVYNIIDSLELPKSQILLISNSTDLEQYMKQKYQDHIHLESYNYLEKLTQRFIKNNGFIDHPKPTEYKKKFICLNRNLREHRIAFLHLLYECDLIKQGYVSCPTIKDYHTWAQRLQNKSDVHQEMRNLFPKLANRLQYDQQLNSILPLIVDTNQIVQTNPAYAAPQNLEPYYTTSYFTIVTETYFFNTNPTHISEKIYKPIAYKHPFVVLSTPGILKNLRNKGYKTFDGIIDESYDNMIDETERLLMVVKEVQRLCSMTTEQIIDFNNKVKAIVDYNQTVLITKKKFIE